MSRTERTFGPVIFGKRKEYSITATAKLHGYFSLTGDITRSKREYAGGQLHEDIAEHFPELIPYIKWHLCSLSSGPMHYVANSIYWAEQGNMEYARQSAIWPEAEIEDFTKEKLEARLPALLIEFKKAMETLFGE